MSTLHEQLLAATADDGLIKDCGECGQPHEAMAALRAVVERHKPSPCCVGHFTCSACGSGRTWPTGCPDTMAIARELGVEIGETPK